MPKLLERITTVTGALLFTAAMAMAYDADRRIIETPIGTVEQTRIAIAQATPCYCQEDCP